MQNNYELKKFNYKFCIQPEISPKILSKLGSSSVQFQKAQTNLPLCFTNQLDIRYITNS